MAILRSFITSAPAARTAGWRTTSLGVDGNPIGCVVLVTRNPAGKTERVVASYRPRTSLLLFAGLLAERFAGTPYANYFQTAEA